jgi:hypothetical protein
VQFLRLLFRLLKEALQAGDFQPHPSVAFLQLVDLPALLAYYLLQVLVERLELALCLGLLLFQAQVLLT